MWRCLTMEVRLFTISCKSWERLLYRSWAWFRVSAGNRNPSVAVYGSSPPCPRGLHPTFRRSWRWVGAAPRACVHRFGAPATRGQEDNGRQQTKERRINSRQIPGLVARDFKGVDSMIHEMTLELKPARSVAPSDFYFNRDDRWWCRDAGLEVNVKQVHTRTVIRYDSGHGRRRSLPGSAQNL
jgi:hypothetical protein